MENHRRKKSAERFGTKKVGNGRAMRLGGKEIVSHSGLFSATFCEGAVEATVLADKGADANMIPPHVLPSTLEAFPNCIITNLEAPRSFKLADKEAAPIVAKRSVKLDVNLSIRYGTNLVLLDVEWAITTGKM